MKGDQKLNISKQFTQIVKMWRKWILYPKNHVILRHVIVYLVDKMQTNSETQLGFFFYWLLFKN